MEKLVEINNENYPEFYNKNIDKYVLINSEKDILGIITIDNSCKCNKIKINVMEEFQGNGYGKTIFKKAIEKYRPAAEKAHELGLGMNAGHDLNLKNLRPFIQAFPWTAEVSIGHAIICDALYLGIQETIQEYLELLK